jgi:DNA-binding MarR family transcriptional regulator
VTAIVLIGFALPESAAHYAEPAFDAYRTRGRTSCIATRYGYGNGTPADRRTLPRGRAARRVLSRRPTGVQRGNERVARGAGLTPQWYLLLLLVKGSEQGNEQATVSELARRMQLAQSTVTELVNRAERVGLVRRTASNLDGRVMHVALTEEGEERFAASFRALTEERRALQQAVAELGR